MPPVSQAQRGFMRQCSTPAGRAAAKGECPPAKVAREFTRADPGGKLPAHKASSSKTAKGYGFD